MKRRLSILLLLLTAMGIGSSVAWGAPFQGQYVCVPLFNLNETPLEIKIREGISCGKDETLMQVHHGSDGAMLLYPSQAPLSPEVKSDLDRYRKYMGLD